MPTKPSREFVTASIVRYSYHGKEHDGKNCFGWWQNECSPCLYCEKEEVCFEVSIGMSKEKYFKALKKDSPKVDF